MKTRRMTAVMLILLMIVMTAAGCGKKSDLTDGQVQQSTASNGLANSFDDADVSYVMVYNPEIYDEFSDSNGSLVTGDFDADMIDTTAVRAGDFPEQSQYNIKRVGQDEMTGDFDFEGYDPSGNRAGGLVTPYSVGDTHDFFCTVGGWDIRSKETFECRYAGEHCYIWTIQSADDVTDDQANTCGEKFDTEIYDADIKMFGEPRYVDEGGKIHILLYDIGNDLSYMTLGYFNLADIVFTSAEVTPEQIDANQLNVDHAILNVNSMALQYTELEEQVYSTMAHEFQHLIFGSSIMCEPNPQLFNTWLNEALSGYAEQAIYPGTKDDDILYIQGSNLIRHGQSLYNFGSESGDIGVYGSVYLFSEFINELGGEEAMHGIHDYIRTTSDEHPTDSASLVEALGPDVVDKINSYISFPETVKFQSDDQEFISKLTLAFYLSMLNGEIAKPEIFDKLDAMTLLYDQLDSCSIEGGGRVILATKDGKFTIPENADPGLMYVGLDKDFKQVTNVIGGASK